MTIFAAHPVTFFPFWVFICVYRSISCVYSLFPIATLFLFSKSTSSDAGSAALAHPGTPADSSSSSSYIRAKMFYLYRKQRNHISVSQSLTPPQRTTTSNSRAYGVKGRFKRWVLWYSAMVCVQSGRPKLCGRHLKSVVLDMNSASARCLEGAWRYVYI